MSQEESCGHCCHHKKVPWYKEKLFVVSAATAVILAIASLVPVLNPLVPAFFEYVGLIWWAILIGVIIGGIVDYYIPQEYLSKMLAGSKKRTVLWSAILGFLLSACSHGILAIAIQLYKKGASISSVVTFLLAAPWANLPIMFLFFGFFGWKALLIIIFALVIAFITGVIFQKLENAGYLEKSNTVKVAKNFSIRADIKRRFKKRKFTQESIITDMKGVLSGGYDLSKMVVWWLVLGALMASAANAFVPSHFFQEYLGPSLLGLGITLVFATIIEVCSEGSAPLAFELYRQTAAFGNSFVFLMAGVATDYTEIGLLWANIGRRTAILLPLITVPQILILGYIFNVMF